MIAWRLGKKINQLTEQGIKVITFNSDIVGSKRQCFVGMDNFKKREDSCWIIRNVDKKEREMS
ncbi:hypothetical protein JG559_00895 [Enterococcus faecalis]|uniref:Uncharacterized protein n=1 Tax=Enterococcus faecalis TaxID=1351 RepID=A0A974NZ54_ENTFL|nr:hypothetical protein JG559_00895 [Enterococcus faecalis]